MMDFHDYQKATEATAIYPKDKAIEYLALGLVSEAGEVAGKVKKIIRDKGGVLDADDRKALDSELGDVLWYVARLADEINVSIAFTAARNIEKLQSRQERGKIGGSGDNR